MEPNYELLKEAYAIIGGIPDNVIDLDAVQRSEGETLDCGTVCCAAGWLAHHPKFQALGLGLPYSGLVCGSLLLKGRLVSYAEAISAVFDIDGDTATSLFCSSRFRRGLLYDVRCDYDTDKDLWLARVRKYLADRGQL